VSELKLTDIFDYSEITDECIKCGKCIPVCTIHNVHADETTSPRGFLDLLGNYHKGRLDLDANAKAIFESCFLCTACVEVCPKSLPTDRVIEQVRADIGKKFGIAWYKKLFFLLLRHRWLNDIAFKLGWVFQTCGFKIQADIDSMSSRFNLPMLRADRVLPSLRKTSFLNKHKHEELIENGGKRRVAIFIGCLGNYNYVNVGESLLEILKHLGIDAFLARDQKCCSAPAYFTGDFDTVDHNAKFNIEYFESFSKDVEAIIVPEATCSAMLKIDYEHYFHDQPQWRERAVAISKKIFMATEWLEKHTDLKEKLKAKGKNLPSVTYHDPCHAKKMQDIYKEPRALLSQNYELVEMSDPNMCCGFGGVTMQSEKYHLAKAAGLPKGAMIKDTNATYVSSECSACRMQINASMNYVEAPQIFKNPIELIAEALRD
jgi:glycolate oxidase iron-sulfur subunit